MARERFGLSFAAGLEESLARSLRPGGKYARDVARENASLPIRLVEEALTALAERTEEGDIYEGSRDLLECTTLTCADFSI